MNALTTALLVVAVTYATAASPCANVCNGRCDLAQQVLSVATPQFAEMVKENADQCKATCDSVCSCTDGCAAECYPPFAECVKQAKADYSTVALAQCQNEYRLCSGACHTKCAVNVVSGVLSALPKTVENLVGAYTDSVAKFFAQFAPPAAE